MRIATHWQDLKVKSVYFIISVFLNFSLIFNQGEKLIFLLIKPFFLFNKKIIFTEISSGFITHWSLAFYGAIIFTFPLFMYFGLLFIGQGVSKSSLFFFYFIASLLMIFTSYSIYEMYGDLLTFFLTFFLNFENNQLYTAVTLEARVDKYFLLLRTTVKISICMYVCFLFLFVSIWWTPRRRIQRKSIYIPLLILLILFSPPDPFLQGVFAVYLTLFTETLLYIITLSRIFLLWRE